MLYNNRISILNLKNLLTSGQKYAILFMEVIDMQIINKNRGNFEFWKDLGYLRTLLLT